MRMLFWTKLAHFFGEFIVKFGFLIKTYQQITCFQYLYTLGYCGQTQKGFSIQFIVSVRLCVCDNILFKVQTANISRKSEPTFT